MHTLAREVEHTMIVAFLWHYVYVPKVLAGKHKLSYALNTGKSLNSLFGNLTRLLCVCNLARTALSNAK